LAVVWVLQALVASCLVWTSAAAHASQATAPTIVLVADRAEAEVIPLLRAELESLGLRVLVATNAVHGSIPTELNQIARKNGAIAAFRVLVAQGVVEVWLADRVTGKVLLREVLVQTSVTKSAESVVVARAVELLRASLLELDIGEPPPGEVTPPPGVERVRAYADQRARFGLYVGAVLLLGSTDFGPVPGLEGRLTWRPVPGCGVAASAALPLKPVSIEKKEYGAADLMATWFSLGGRLEGHLSETPALRSAMEVGMGALWTRIWAVNVVDPHKQGPPFSDINPMPYLRLEGAWAVGRNWSTTLGLMGGYGLRPERVLFGSEESEPVSVGRFGRFLASAALGLEAIWP
jgi:hypothetical protein